MNDLPDSFIVVGSIVAGIMILTFFFKLINWIECLVKKNPTRIAFKGVLNEQTRVTVFLANGTTFENVRLRGFTDTSSMKEHLPYELNNMVILEHANGRHSLIPARNIRIIETQPEAT